MFKYGISCSLEPQPVRQPVIIRGEIEHVADQVKKAGYDAIELFIRNPEQYDPFTAGAEKMNSAVPEISMGGCPKGMMK